MLGETELKKIFPNFEDLVQPSGIDLELDEIFVQKSEGSLIDNEKNLFMYDDGNDDGHPF